MVLLTVFTNLSNPLLSRLSPQQRYKFVVRLDEALAKWEAAVIEKILESRVIDADETSLRVNKKTIGSMFMLQRTSCLSFCTYRRNGYYTA
jgi:hypothetical protein